MAGFLPNGIAMRVQNITLANSGVDGSGMSRCSIELYSSVDLDPANTGSPIGFVEDGLVFQGYRYSLEDVMYVNSSSAVNYPSELNALGNRRYGSQGFVGYITSLSPSTSDGNSSVRMELGDERWKWGQIELPSIRFNSYQYPGIVQDPDTFYRQTELSAKEVIAFVERYVRSFHTNFIFDDSILPDRTIGEIAMGGPAYDFLVRFLQEQYGNKYQLYSPGAGHLEVVEVETRINRLRNFRVDTDQIIENQMSLSRGPGEGYDLIIGIGANRQYYVGEGEYDNELVPDWDWWNDGRILIIDKQTMAPAMYQDTDGRVRLVNPFNFRIDVSNPKKVKYLSPSVAGGGSNVLSFVASVPNAASYPSLRLFIKMLEGKVGGVSTHSLVSKFVYATNYGIDALTRANALREPIHNGRFRRFRLKDDKPRYYSEWDGSQSVYYDWQVFPLRPGKKYAGDPAGLNRAVLSGYGGVQDIVRQDFYQVAGESYYEGYKVVILDQFINNSSHRIAMMREKPGTYLSAFRNVQDLANFYETPDDNDPRFVKGAPSYGPICVKYDLLQTRSVDSTGSSVVAERVKVDGFQIVNGNRVIFSEPQVMTTHSVDTQLFLPNEQETTAIGPVAFYDSTLRNPNGIPIGEGLKWYRLFKVGSHSQPFEGVRTVIQPVRKSKPYPKKDVDYDQDAYIYQETVYPLAVPRLELYCFVQYSDIPEREKLDDMVNMSTGSYWRNVKSVFAYPHIAGNLRNRRVKLEYRDNFVIQEGGIYDYTGNRHMDRGKFEVIAFYDDAQINIAEDFELGDKPLQAYGQKRTILQFQLRNDSYKFEMYGREMFSQLVPKGQASYHQRPDFFPEQGGRNVFISSVTHTFGGGWRTEVSYGGQTPRIKDLYYRDFLFSARQYQVLESMAGVQTTRIGGTAQQGTRTT